MSGTALLRTPQLVLRAGTNFCEVMSCRCSRVDSPGVDGCTAHL